MRALILAALLAFTGASAETTPFERLSYDEVRGLGWEFQYCKIWLGSDHNGECVWRLENEVHQSVAQATCYMWDLFSANEEMSCVVQNLHPDYPVTPSVPLRVKEPFPGERILWNDALARPGFEGAYCRHEPRMQACYAYGTGWFTVCRQFQAAGKLKCRVIDV